MTKGYEALVDDADYDVCSKYKWSVSFRGKRQIYASTKIKFESKWRTIDMHRLILNLIPGDGKEVDHVNMNGLDNQRSNLRICTRAQNEWNKIKLRCNTSGYKGVSYHRISKSWRAMISANGKQHYLGLFSTAELAAEAYKQAALRYHGEFANTGET